MEKAELIVQAPAQWAIKGVINFHTVVALRTLGDKAIKNNSADSVQVDLAEVTHASSSAITLMLAWMRHTKCLRKTIKFINVPQSIIRVADVCGVLPTLDLAQ